MKNRKIYRYTQGELKINLYKQTPSGNPEFFYNMIHNIGGVPVNMINASDVQVYIDNGSAVLGVYAFRTNYVEFNPSGISHMVTIVGYDNNNYICIDPDIYIYIYDYIQQLNLIRISSMVILYNHSHV